MKIIIETIPHQLQRYPTVGDYWRDKDGTLQVRISAIGKEEYALMVMIHELVEIILVEAAGIPFSAIDRFDKLFEKEREQGKHGNAEPGDDPRAPYREQHFIATNIERQLCAALHLDWAKYDKAVNAL